MIHNISAEYKDVWQVENKWNSSNELRSHFYKVKKEMDMNNQVVEDFFEEAIVMKTFNHPNVLSLIGVSVYNNKPCVLMPLMNNGDLKTYIQNNNNLVR